MKPTHTVELRFAWSLAQIVTNSKPRLGFHNPHALNYIDYQLCARLFDIQFYASICFCFSHTTTDFTLLHEPSRLTQASHSLVSRECVLRPTVLEKIHGSFCSFLIGRCNVWKSSRLCEQLKICGCCHKQLEECCSDHIQKTFDTIFHQVFSPGRAFVASCLKCKCNSRSILHPLEHFSNSRRVLSTSQSALISG